MGKKNVTIKSKSNTSKLPAELRRRSPERKEAADGHVHGHVLVPGLRRDLPGDVASATGRLEAARPVLAHDAANDGEGEAHQHPGAEQQKHSGGRQGLCRATPPVDGVDHAPRQEERRWEKQGAGRAVKCLIMNACSLKCFIS